MLRGDAGAGKSALLNFVAERATGWRVASAVGVESEMELAYGGLHQLCAPMLDHADQLPTPQRDALGTVFGLLAGEPPDRFLVGLATLTLLAEVADDRQPLLCVIDDVQWLDAASAQIVLFIARRFLAERIVLVCAARSGVGDGILAGLPALPVHGLSDHEARKLLLENLLRPDRRDRLRTDHHRESRQPACASRTATHLEHRRTRGRVRHSGTPAGREQD